MRHRLPNQLTILRLLLAAVFFMALNQFRYSRGHEQGWILWTAMAVFIFGMLTDIADGYLARRWKVESTFGRIMDPFVDKVMVLGALIYLASTSFVDSQAVATNSLFTMVSGIYPWMIAVVLARELLVTGIRGEMESRGLKFGAKVSGKIKTMVQSVGIPFILGVVALDPNEEGHNWMIWVRDVFAYGMVVTTIASGIPYVTSAVRAMKRNIE